MAPKVHIGLNLILAFVFWNLKNILCILTNKRNIFIVLLIKATLHQREEQHIITIIGVKLAPLIVIMMLTYFY
jgi:hypothetical protein